MDKKLSEPDKVTLIISPQLMDALAELANGANMEVGRYMEGVLLLHAFPSLVAMVQQQAKLP